METGIFQYVFQALLIELHFFFGLEPDLKRVRPFFIPTRFKCRISRIDIVCVSDLAFPRPIEKDIHIELALPKQMGGYKGYLLWNFFYSFDRMDGLSGL